MKHLFLLLASAAFTFSAAAETIEILPQYGYMNPGGTEVDLNNDGYQDLIIGGHARTDATVQDPDGNDVVTNKTTQVLLFNPSTKVYDLVSTNILNADRAQFIPADFNGDGIMDLVCAEHDLGVLYGGGIYEGNGDGTFTKKTPTFSDPTYPFKPVAVVVGDMNNDGLPDIVAIGYQNINSVAVSSSAVLINKGNYDFEVTSTDLLQEYNLALAVVKVLDYNNDGYLDFFVSANCDNAANGGARVLADIFANLGTDGPGEFYRLSLGDGTIFQKANGGLDIADLNNDGWLDFAIHGEGGDGTGEPIPNNWSCKSHVYMNNKSGSFTEKAEPNLSADLRPLNSSGNSTRLFDWNGDGFLDLFVPGWNPSPETGTQAGFYYLNDGLGTFGAANRIPGGSEITLCFPDWNGDGIKDYFMSGQSWDATYFTGDNQGRTAAVLLNDVATEANVRPTAPTGLEAAVTDNKVVLSWAAATDTKTPANGLSYEYYIKDNNGKIYNGCRSFIGGANDGVRKVMDIGNAMLNKSISLSNIPSGAYTWGVQAIDASFEGSVFANGSFTIGGSAVKNLDANSIKVLSTNGKVTINSQSPVTIQVISLNGITVASAKSKTAFSCDLAQGAYIVKIIAANQTTVTKVVVR